MSCVTESMQHDQHGVDLAKPGRNSCSNRPSARCSTVLRWAAVTLLFASIQAASSCSMGHARHHLSWQRQPHAVEGLPAAAAGRHGRSLHAMVELQQTKTKRGNGMLNKVSSKLSYDAPPFVIRSVSLSLSFTPPKVAVTNFMEIEPYSSSSCNPQPREPDEADADADAEGETAAHVTDSSSSRPGLSRRVSKLTASSRSRIGATADMVCGLPLELDTVDSEIFAIWLDGRLLSRDQYRLTKKERTLAIYDVPARLFTLKIMSKTAPPADRQAGLFVHKGYYAVSFEPYGIQRLTPYIDQPDILPLWTIRLEADAKELPVLLSNGDLVQQGKLPNGRHFVVWKDPRPHSSYQTSIVAGKLALRQDTYISCITGKAVQLKLYLPPNRIQSADFAMYVLKAAMAWFEAAWGQPYRQDTYTMVGLPGIQGEATESSQMGVFNVNFLTGTPSTRADKDAEAALRLIGHELFHTWSGNYVTVQSWNDLVLKEGLTTYMEQAFAADMDTAEAAAMNVIKLKPPFKTPPCAAAKGSSAPATERSEEAAAAAAGVLPFKQLLPYLRGVAACRAGKGGCGDGVVDLEAADFYWRRIADVAYLRRHQVPEDDGDMPHPLRLTNTSKIYSPYTNTIYRKGAEAIRMYRLMMGPPAFAKGLGNWFSQFYGKAATMDEFHQTMTAAAPGSLPPNWLNWYDQPGTPWVSVQPSYDAKAKTLKLQMEQGNMVVEDGYPGVTYSPLAIPLKVGLLTDEGDNLPLKLQGSAAGSRVLASEDSETAQLLLTTKKATFTLQNVPQQPVVSVLRGFSAPVRALVDPQSLDDIALIAKSDRDVFARFNAINRLLTRRTLYELYWAAADDGGKETPSEIKRDVQRAVDAAGGVDGVPEALIAAYKAVLAEDQPGGTKGYMLSVPGIQDMENSVESPEPLLLWQVRQHVGKVLAQQLQPDLQLVVQQEDARAAALPAGGFTGPAMNARHAANNALRMLAFNWTPELERQVVKRYYSSGAMSDRLTALKLLVGNAAQETADAALSHFRKTYANEPDSIIEWLRVQGASDRPGNLKNLQRLLSSPSLFDMRDTEAVVALLNEGLANSAVNFEAADGSGYKFLFDAILQVDKVNSQASSMLLSNFADFEGMSRPRRKLVKAQLKRLSTMKSQLSSALQETLEWMD